MLDQEQRSCSSEHRIFSQVWTSAQTTENFTLHLSKATAKLLSPIIWVRFQGASSIPDGPSADTQLSFSQCSAKSDPRGLWAVTRASGSHQNCWLRHPALQRTPTSPDIYYAWKGLSQHLDTDLTHHMANTASATLNSATLWNRWLWTEIWSNFNRGVLSPLGTNPSVSQFTPALALTHSSYQSTASPRARCRSWQARLCCRSQSSLHQPPQPTCLVTSHMNLGILQTG